MGMQRIKALTEKQVSEMIELKKAGKSLTEIAGKYNVTVSTVSRRISEKLGLREKKSLTSGCTKSISDCLNCTLPECNYNGGVQSHEKFKCVNAFTVDMLVDTARKA